MKRLEIQKATAEIKTEKDNVLITVEHSLPRKCSYEVNINGSVAHKGEINNIKPTIGIYEVINKHGYLKYYDMRNTWSWYYFKKANVGIKLKTPHWNSDWIVLINYKNGKMEKRDYSQQEFPEQGNITESLIKELGLPPNKYNNKM